jgi:hypothetical protein
VNSVQQYTYNTQKVIFSNILSSHLKWVSGSLNQITSLPGTVLVWGSRKSQISSVWSPNLCHEVLIWNILCFAQSAGFTYGLPVREKDNNHICHSGRVIYLRPQLYSCLLHTVHCGRYDVFGMPVLLSSNDWFTICWQIFIPSSFLLLMTMVLIEPSTFWIVN